jgi:NAD(P)-dependent dehydrogenase (short-subunit alcohol dehydrogenase family)
MKVLVTGANVFLGRHVVSALLARGYRAMVRPAVRLETLGWPSSVEILRADLRTSRELRSAFEGVDVLLHLAAVVTGQGTESGLTLEMSEDRGEIVDIPAGALSPEFDAALVVDCPGEIYREVSDDSHVSCTMPLSQA